MAKKAAKRGPKITSESERKVIVPASVPAGLVKKLAAWANANNLNRSQAVTEAIRRLVN